MTFVVAGTQIVEFQFSSMIAQTMSSFMFVATGALILPAAYDAGLGSSTEAGVLALSRGTAIILLIVYILFLIYQLKTHPHVFETEGLHGEEDGDDTQEGRETAERGETRVEEQGLDLGEQATEVIISPLILASTLFIVTTAVSFCSDYLVGSIDDVVVSLGISKTFIGLILVPMVGNAGIFSRILVFER